MKAVLAAVAVLLAGCGGGEGGPAVLDVRVPDGEATAFAIGGGRVLTVAHVLRGDDTILVATRQARVIRVDRRLDVAILAIGGGDSAVRIGAARAGEPVTVRVLRDGVVRSLHATVRRVVTARVRDLSGRVRVRPALELAAAVMPGDSGAPVVDAGGRVVGVVFAQASGDEALTYALDARALRSELANSPLSSATRPSRDPARAAAAR